MREHKFKSIITCIAVLTFAFVILSSIKADATSTTTGLTRENNGLSTTAVTKMTSYEYTEVFTELIAANPWAIGLIVKKKTSPKTSPEIIVV